MFGLVHGIVGAAELALAQNMESMAYDPTIPDELEERRSHWRGNMALEDAKIGVSAPSHILPTRPTLHRSNLWRALISELGFYVFFRSAYATRWPNF